MLVVNELFIEIHKNHPLSSAQLRFWPSVQCLGKFSLNCQQRFDCTKDFYNLAVILRFYMQEVKIAKQIIVILSHSTESFSEIIFIISHILLSH